MDEEDAVEYLQEKGEIRDRENPKFNKAEKAKIKEVVKEGKIYGDPIVELNEY
jgi:hypothetical protein